jgi:phosphoribosylaminoimidazole-succinocarboxamide synthase
MTNKLIIFISGEGTNLQAIIDSVNTKVLNAEITCVISNKKNANGLNRALKANIATKVFEFKRKSESKQQYEQRILEFLSEYDYNLIVLAGFMYVFTNYFLSRTVNVVNLHPALPGMFPGKNAIGQAWEAYQKKKNDRGVHGTGVMVHDVIEEIDAGKVIGVQKVPIYPNDTLQSLQERVRYYEKPLLISSIAKKLQVIDNNHSSNKYVGKVRDCYDLGYDVLAMNHSNRQSAFDRHICHIPNKGKLLTETSVWWFDRTQYIIPNHYLHHHDNVMIVKKCVPFKVEVVVRGYITGSTKTSLWTHYNNGARMYCGITFQDGLVKNQKLDRNYLTPTTKGIVDEPISSEDIVLGKLMTQREWDYVSSKALELFEYGQMVASDRGLILVDTKYEFGKDKHGNILLIDEIHTCDSSRFWIKESYQNMFDQGLEPEKLDKDSVRQYVRSKCDPYTDPLPEIPDELITKTRSAYHKFYEMLTGLQLQSSDGRTKEAIIQNYFDNHHNKVIIMAGSKSDDWFVDKLKAALNSHNMYHKHYVSSAHKNTHDVLNILGKYNKQKHVVFITVAGRSNALSAVCAYHSKHPVIACPPFKDKVDMQTNIHSTLQCPSNIPVMTVLDPGNAVLAVKAIMGL